MNVSLIITTYNWHQALAVVLDSALRQSYRNFEIVIADDGSDQRTYELVKLQLSNTPIAWRHVRHGDSGIRQARIKNLAVRYAQGDYFIFIDHDVALHPRFIQDHVKMRQKHLFLQGKRVFLPSTRTERYLSSGIFHPPSPWAGGLENRKNAFYFPTAAKWVNRLKRFQVTLRGCNLSMDRATFMAVDGYDEVFDDLWGREDSDICYRMFNSGYRIRNLWLAGLQYHLEHPSIKRRDRDRLDEELEMVVKSKRTRAIKGYSQMSSEGECIAGWDQ